MSETKEFTYAEVASHSSKKDLYVVIHEKVYNTSSFVDEHPGGEEVLLDVSGQDATDAFEDVGHSDEAREILEKLLIGELKREPGDPPRPPPPEEHKPKDPNSSGNISITLYALIFVGALVAFGAYKYLQTNESASK